MQSRQQEWLFQWERFRDDCRFLFLDWIWPNDLESLRGLDVLEAGCGQGQHTRILSEVAATVTAVDLNTAPLLVPSSLPENVRVVEADIAQIDLGRVYDVVMSIGVVHHTDDPDATVANLRRHVRNGGRLILWVYSREGNALVRWLVEPARKTLLRLLPRSALVQLARVVALFVALAAHTLYRLRLPWLPYYAYMENWRRLTFPRNVLNVFDKLNAPQTQFITRKRALAWSQGPCFEVEHLSSYLGVSWRITLRCIREDG
jgi:2-polyprenyl-3-methyl-5-hydroxy-6-metoxy-1,4-benzoquinol methylase